MEWMLGKIVAKEELRERRERIRRMGEEEQRKEIEREKERRKERRRRRKLKKKEKRRAEREKERQRMAKMMRKKEREKKRRRKEKERQRRQAKQEEEDRQRRRRRDKKRQRRRKAELSTSSSSSSSSSDESGEPSSASERSVSSASDSERSEEEKASSSSSPSSDEDKVEGQEVYCYCRQPMSEHVPMICCDVCSEWYHGKCVSLTAADMDNIDSYVCAKCEKHSERRTTRFNQPNDEIDIAEQQPRVPAIRLKRVRVTDAMETAGELERKEGDEQSTSEEAVEGTKAEVKEAAPNVASVLYEVVSNEGAELAEEADTELLSQPLRIHRAASLKLRLSKQHSEGRASRRQQLWRVTRVVGKNVYWARESGLNWHYIRETAISSKDKRWTEAPGVEKVYAENGQWLIEEPVVTENESDVIMETDEDVTPMDGVAMEGEGDAGQQPAVVQRRSHKKKAAALKRSHKRKVRDEPAAESVQQKQQQQEDSQLGQQEGEPSNPPVEATEPPQPPSPKIRRPPRPRMSEAQRLLTSYLNPPGQDSDSEDNDTVKVEEEDVRGTEVEQAVDEEETNGRRRSSRRRLVEAVVKEEQEDEEVDEVVEPVEDDEEETVQATPSAATRRSTRSRATPPPLVDTTAARPSRAASPTAAGGSSPVAGGRSTRRALAASQQSPAVSIDINGRSSRIRDKRKQLDDTEPPQQDELRGLADQRSEVEPASPAVNGITVATNGKYADGGGGAHTSSSPTSQRSKRQRRIADLELIDGAQIFAQRSRRAAATNNRQYDTPSAEEEVQDEDDDMEAVEEAQGVKEEENVVNGVGSEDDEQQQQQQQAALHDNRRRSTRSKPTNTPQPTPPPSNQRAGGVGSASRKAGQATLHKYFAR